MHWNWRQSLAGAVSLGVLGIGMLGAQARQSKEKVDFNRDIRPILSKCMACHGPDSGAAMADLRLDNFEGATKTLPSGRRAIVPGKPTESELVKRINAKDRTLMPPASTHKTVSDAEKQLLADWIEEGAEYKEHWAFVTPLRPVVPTVNMQGWARGELDRFVLAKMEQHGLSPEAEADRRTLIRRVSLDVTGLPPTPAEADAFVGDRSKNAYEKVVDRLLASPRYGERMAMDWMDYARYADSNGYQADYERFQSRWRDWVIEAFNKNMPYDQFTIEQIAGDLLPNATMEQKLATAFNRNHRINTEGGVIAEEWRIETLVDRVETTSAVWLGLTAGCARCHDHKYDPITQKDFYRLAAYFNNVPESGTGEERPVNHPPLLKAPTEEQSARMAALDKQIAALKKDMDARLAANAQRSQKWIVSAAAPDVAEGLVAKAVLAPNAPGVKLVGKATFELGRVSGSVKTDEASYADLGEIGDFERDQPFSYGAWIRPEVLEGAPFSRMESANSFRGWECSLVGGRVQAHLINKWPENGLKIATKMPVPAGRWTHVFITYDGSSKAAGLKLYLDGKLAETNVENDSLKDTIRTNVTTKIGRRTETETFKGEVDELRLYSRALKPEEVAKLASAHPALKLATIPIDKRTKAEADELARLWSMENDPKFVKLDETYRPAVKAREDLAAQIPDVMVMEEMPKPRDCFVLIRGQYDQHGEKVEAGLPSFLPSPPAGTPNNRLGLAKWIVSPTNPLTSRVTVNRLWERFFGQGLVSTIEDFGTRADFPTHPELLDYLATEFIRLKWDLKAMIKQIVTSATYRQDSRQVEAKLHADPTNKWLSRGPRYRLQGEIIRDQALFVSGLLTEKLGGPSVRPYMPDKVWDETNVYGNLRNYQHDKGPNLYRRSLYTIWKRTAAPPNMLLFDVPSREACRVRRSRTDTPLQALTLLNDVTFVEAARVLAQRMMRDGGLSPQDRITYAFRKVLSRNPNAEELKILLDGLQRRIASYRKNPAAARDLATTGEARIDVTLDRAELAAYTIVASTLLNLDEAVTKE
ncbi:MAG: DUF1553 domain-containing protein [Fimbriimonadaceae bacterium]|nr:DUF1553 domain-containing protein [Fimbriimonadaceae bacterium]